MTSVFGADGKNIPCTVIEVGPCVVTQLKTVEKDGYEAVQVGFMPKSEKHTNKAEAGHFKAAGVQPMRHLAEFDGFDKEVKLGDTLTVDMFEENTYVDVIGTSKGKGFQGVVKRHGFGGGSRFGRCVRISFPYFPGHSYGRSHGTGSCYGSEPGSIESYPRIQPLDGQGFDSRSEKQYRYH